MTTKNDDVLIKVEGLHKIYGDFHALNGINEEIHKGEVVVVVGPSGSGKSTFLRSLNLLEVPDQGHIYFEGVDITDKHVDINKHRQKMGMVFQHFNLFSNKTVIQNIMLAPVYVQCQELRKAKRKNAITGFTNIFRGKENKKQLIPVTTTKTEIKKKARENAMSLLGRIGLQDKADVYPSTLSGGQKQRLTIARAVVRKPEILILDDSASALDFATDAALRKAIREKTKGMTVFLVSQRASTIMNSDKIIVMDDGQIAGIGTHRQLLSNCEIYREICQSQLSEEELSHE